jgi:hypothetical protein
MYLTPSDFFPDHVLYHPRNYYVDDLMSTRPAGIGAGGRDACCLQDRAPAGGKVGEGQARCQRVECGIIENRLIDFPQRSTHIHGGEDKEYTHMEFCSTRTLVIFLFVFLTPHITNWFQLLL